MESRQGEVVVITGASAGVGRATAQAFARRGAKIGLMARGMKGLEATRDEVEALGGEALVLPGDIADAGYVESAAQAVEDRFGPIDIWINNAMTSIFAEFKDITPEEYRRVTDVTYHGTVYGTMAALKRMRPRDRGSIVLVGSALAYRGIPLQSAYCGAKHAIQGMFDSVRSELLHAKSNVRISMVHLPAVNTPQFRWVLSKLPRKAQPVPPIFQPELMADAIMWAAYNEKREMVVGFPSLKAIVGNKLAPAFADWYLSQTGYESQMIDEPEDPNRPSNLWEPVDTNPGAHGVFDDRAKSYSPQVWLNKNKRWVSLAGTGLAAVAAGFMLRR
jgi:NAD(P)-dependent dehydrogenase (short-subunit alcohol dehydrogenase family)